MGWVTQWAPTPEELAACVQCGLCLPHCPTFRLTGRESASPRGRLTAMSAVASGAVPVDDAFEDLMTFCLQCRACEAVCPSLVPFGRAMEGARAEVAAQLPGRGSRVRRLVAGRAVPSSAAMSAVTAAAAAVQRLRLHRLMPGVVRSRLAGLRPLALRPARLRGRVFERVGPAAGSVALLAGCVMEPWFGSVHDATVEVLRRAGYRVTVPDTQTCCGALAAHEGAVDAARGMAARNLEAFEGFDLVVADAAGCGAHLKDYAHWAEGGGDLADRVRDITEVVAAAIEEGRLPRLEEDRGAAAVQDPCHLRHAQRITAAPRTIVAAAGYRVVEIDEDGLCCGAAGLYTLARPEAADELGRAKADLIRATGARVVASANPGCEMQLRSRLESGYRVAHPVELYLEALQDVVS